MNQMRQVNQLQNLDLIDYVANIADKVPDHWVDGTADPVLDKVHFCELVR